MIGDYDLWVAVYSEGLHFLAGLFLLGVLYQTFSDLLKARNGWGIVLLSLFLFSVSWLLHIGLDKLQNVF